MESLTLPVVDGTCDGKVLTVDERPTRFLLTLDQQVNLSRKTWNSWQKRLRVKIEQETAKILLKFEKQDRD